MCVRGGMVPSDVQLQSVASKAGWLTVAFMYRGMAGLGHRWGVAERLVVLTHRKSS